MAELSHCGIDVSKDRLDVVVLPNEQCFSVVNAAAGWAELIEKLRGLNIAAIGIEASGGYERGIVRALLAARQARTDGVRARIAQRCPTIADVHDHAGRRIAGQ